MSLARCPICKRKATQALKPFCSQRCADADLALWLGGGYAIPGPEVEELPDMDLPDRPRNFSR
ncbi:DNA gyrase inhibitor YacG [Roseinatronobacter sp. NSM]|uniref:DNA gyrase inhibitor YacG n=1 Tax=Roseinatronobacter sp. NSM TaxID=3457785 RepID=UPI0040373491